MAKRQIVTGVHRGGGPPPGYQWGIALLSVVKKEAECLTQAQRRHLAMQLRELAGQDEPTRSDSISLDEIEAFHELRDWGGILGDLNVRLFFGVDKNNRLLVVLGIIKKKNNGPTPLGDKVRMRRRWRKYRNGEYGMP